MIELFFLKLLFCSLPVLKHFEKLLMVFLFKMSHIDNTKIEAYDFPYDQSSFGQSNVDQKSLNPEEMIEEAARKREHRLIKNREAARECRRKKKEYIKVFLLCKLLSR